MSKLYEKYLVSKASDSNKLYLFKSGMFFICLDNDARKLNEIFKFKLTPLTDTVVKCGFPENRLNYYIQQLEHLNIPFEIIDSSYAKVENYSDYLNNSNIKSIIKYILDLDLNDISFKRAYEILEKLQSDLKKFNS